MKLVVTRHAALIEYLYEINLIKKDEELQIVEHVPYDHMVFGRDVIGVLPLRLASHCNSLTEVPLNITAEMRGKELTIEQIREFAGEPATYRIEKVRTEPVLDPYVIGKKMLEMMGYKVKTSGFGYNSVSIGVYKDGEQVFRETIGE